MNKNLQGSISILTVIITLIIVGTTLVIYNTFFRSTEIRSKAATNTVITPIPTKSIASPSQIAVPSISLNGSPTKKVSPTPTKKASTTSVIIAP